MEPSLTDDELLADFDELVKKFGMGESSVEGTPEGNELWALTHQSPVVVSVRLSEGIAHAVNVANEAHFLAAPTNVIFFSFDGVKASNISAYLSTSVGELTASLSSARLYVGVEQQTGKLTLEMPPPPTPSGQRPLAAVLL